jgi:Outer membrane protein beta-barrel domain
MGEDFSEDKESNDSENSNWMENHNKFTGKLLFDMNLAFLVIKGDGENLSNNPEPGINAGLGVNYIYNRYVGVAASFAWGMVKHEDSKEHNDYEVGWFMYGVETRFNLTPPEKFLLWVGLGLGKMEMSYKVQTDLIDTSSVNTGAYFSIGLGFDYLTSKSKFGFALKYQRVSSDSEFIILNSFIFEFTWGYIY